MKVYLRIPTNTAVDRCLADWLVYIARALPDADIAHYDTSCFGIAEGRNDIVTNFLKTDCTHLWMVDSDTCPPYTTALLEHDLPVVCGPYMGWNTHVGLVWHVYHFLRRDEHGKDHYATIPRSRWPSDRAFQADAAGTGCMLIRRDVLEQHRRTPRPFYHVLNPDGSHGTEDLTFCRDIGGVWIDQYYTCEHYRDLPLSLIQRRAVVS